MGVFYVWNYLRHVSQDDARHAELKQYLSFGLCILLIQLEICFLMGAHAVNYLGLAAAVAGVLSCSSPLSTLSEVFRTGSAESWPTDLVVASFLQSIIAFCFGIVADDVW